MSTEESNLASPAKPSPQRFQFSLRTLLGLVAACGLFFGMVAWRGELGALEFFLGAAVCLIAVGVFTRRISLILVGVLVLVGIRLGVSYSARRTAVSTGSGWCTMVVPLKVVDAASGQPIRNAMVRVLSGSADPNRARTDADGIARVDSQMMFIVEQYDTLFGTRGGRWISFSGIAAEVDAEGYRSVRVPLSTHFGESRDLPGDPLPLVTVELERTRSTPRHQNDAEKRTRQE